MESFLSPFGELKLARWPLRKNETLRAWDAADELLLGHLAEQKLFDSDTPRLLIVNDAYGALTCALRDYQPVNWSDSCISHLAAQENIGLNSGVDELRTNSSNRQKISVDSAAGATGPDISDTVLGADSSASAQTDSKASSLWKPLRSTESPEGFFDLVLIKVPKTNALLEDQLIRLRPHLHKDSVIIAAGMVKHLQKSAFQCFEKNIGPLTTSLAKKKARLIFATLDETIAQPENPYPTSYTEAEIDLTLSNHASVFSRDHLDLGARFFLTQFPEMPDAARVIDLASGNGVLGIKYQQKHPNAQLRFIDESYMAVASSQENYQAVFPDVETASFEAVEGLSQTESASADLIICNPPFHQQHVIGEQIALSMFRDSKRCLAAGGELWIVANHHLGYQEKLKQMFGNCRTVGSNKKFVVFRVVKR